MRIEFMILKQVFAREEYRKGRKIDQKKARSGTREDYGLVRDQPFLRDVSRRRLGGTTALAQVYRDLITSPRKPLLIYAEYFLAADLPLRGRENLLFEPYLNRWLKNQSRSTNSRKQRAWCSHVFLDISAS